MKFNNFIKLGVVIASVTQLYAVETGKVHHVKSESEFNSLISSGKAAIVKFEAEWCGPCKKSAPIFEQMAAKHPAILFISVDIDKVPSLAKKHGIKSVPALIMFDESGKKVQTLSKGFNSSEILDAIKPFEGEKKNSKDVKTKKTTPAPKQKEKVTPAVKKEEPKKAAPAKTETKEAAKPAKKETKKPAAKCPTGKGMIAIKDNDHLKDIVKDGSIVVAKFEADWCAPCKDAEEPLSYIVEEYPDVTFVSVDIDTNKEAKKEHEIANVPTFVIFKNGKEIDRLVSFFDPALRAKIDDAKSGKKSAMAQVKYTSGPTVS